MYKKNRFAQSAETPLAPLAPKKVSLIDIMEGLMACFIVFLFGALTAASLFAQEGVVFKAMGALVAAMDCAVIAMIAKKYLRAR